MTEEQRMQITSMRDAGNGYKKIAQTLDISENTVRASVSEIKWAVWQFLHQVMLCLCCRKAVKQNPGRKQKKFCFDKCRMKWWNSHLDQVQKKAEYARKEVSLRSLYEEKRSRYAELDAIIQQKDELKEIMTNFINNLRDLTREQTEFRAELWGGLVDYIEVKSETEIKVVFRGGIEVII